VQAALSKRIAGRRVRAPDSDTGRENRACCVAISTGVEVCVGQRWRLDSFSLSLILAGSDQALYRRVASSMTPALWPLVCSVCWDPR
jgi:site-specific DNA-cytosine methylase